MIVRSLFALTSSEMGVSTSVLALIVALSIVFFVGFAKSSMDNEYMKLMDSFIERNEESN